MLEELQRLLDRHVEHVGDALALEADLERLAVVALAVALFARHVDVGQEVHLDLDLPVAAADLAAPALDVEAEAARLVAARPRLLGLREEVADHVEQARVGRRVRARRAPDRRLVDGDDLVELLEAVDRAVRARALARAVQAVGDRLVEHVVDERRLARAGHAGDAGQHAQRDVHVDVAQVVLARRRGSRCSRSGCAACAGTSIAPRAREELAGQRLGHALDLGRRALRDDPPAVLAGARAEVDEVVGRAHRLLVVLDDDHGVAEVAQALERRDQLRVVALVQADRGLVEDVEHAHQRGADLGRQPDPLRLAARQRRGRAAPSTGSRCRRSRGSAGARRSRAGSGARRGGRSRTARPPRATRARGAPRAR